MSTGPWSASPATTRPLEPAGVPAGVHRPRQGLGDPQQRAQHPQSRHHVRVRDREVTDDVGAALREPLLDDLSALVAAGADGEIRAAGGDLQGCRTQQGELAGLARRAGLVLRGVFPGA